MDVEVKTGYKRGGVDDSSEETLRIRRSKVKTLLAGVSLQFFSKNVVHTKRTCVCLKPRGSGLDTRSFCFMSLVAQIIRERRANMARGFSREAARHAGERSVFPRSRHSRLNLLRGSEDVGVGSGVLGGQRGRGMRRRRS